MIISPFTPIFFEDFKSDGIESRYLQTFATSDQILLEAFTAPGESVYTFSISGTTDDGNTQNSNLNLNTWQLSDGTKLSFTVLSGLAPGVYQIKNIRAGLTSHYFRVINDSAELAKTTLIQYSMKDNKQRQDALFIIGGQRYFFDFRVPGGFKDSGWTFAVENEQFMTPEADPVELYALESTQKKFTMGGQGGVPVYFGELLNRLLTCTYVYFDGVRYARKDSSVPEMSVPIEGIDSFVFSQLLQKVNNLNPTIENSNHHIMRRVKDDEYRTIIINNAITQQGRIYNRLIK